MFVSLPCSLVVLIAIDVALAFQDRLAHNRNPSIVGRSLPLLTTSGSASTSNSFSRTALYNGNIFGMEGDPLEEDRRQRNAIPQKRFVPHQKRSADLSAQGDIQEQEMPKQRLVRPSKPPSNDNERKATTSTTAGVNMELKDPKERKLVRHATASSAYGVDAFKGKKKKIIKPWSSGRKRQKNKQNNTGGIAREAYGEELRIELRNKPKEKRLVMATTSGNQDAAKALISGGSLTAEDLAEEKRLMDKRSRKLAGEDVEDDDDYYYDGVKYVNDNDDSRENRDEDKPTLARLASSVVKEPEENAEDEPNLVRLSSSIVRPPDDDDSEEPNLVRLESSIVREAKQETEDELKFYTRYENSVEEQEKEQRLVRAVPASQPPSSDEPKLVRPNFVKEEVEGSKLVKPNIFRSKPEGPKLVKPNVYRTKLEGPKLVKPNLFRAKPEGPKLVRANVQRENRPKSKLVRAKIMADGMDVGKGLSTSGQPLVRPPSSTKNRKGTQAEDFMYGANAATSSPTVIPVDGKSKAFAKPAFTSSERSPKNAMENLMYGANTAATNPTAVSIEDSNLKQGIGVPDSNFDNPMDNLMYGANQATKSPTAIPFETGSNKKFVRPVENISEGSASDDSVRVGSSQSVPMDSLSPDFEAMDDLMYGHQGSISSPTAVQIETSPIKYVKSEKVSAGESSSEGNISGTSTTIYPDGDKRKETNQPRLVRSPTSQINTRDSETNDSKLKRYVKASTSAMDRAMDWDASNPTSMTTNPTFVRNIGRGTKSDTIAEEPKKKYIQPSTSLMDNAPDWDAVQPITSTANPSVISVAVSKSKESKPVSEEKKSEAEEPKKKYVQPSSSLMDNVPDWDAVQPATSTTNPSQVYINVPQQKRDWKNEVGADKSKDDVGVDKPRKKQYVQPSASLMDSVPDWDAVQPATSAANPSVVNVDGINNAGKEKRFVRSSALSMEEETKPKARTEPADTPFEYKQIQSIPNENPAGAKPIGDEDTKTKLPAAIAHAAGSSSEGWTPQAHFPSDDESSNTADKTSSSSVNRRRTSQLSTMKNFDPDALPRPTGVIPLTVSSSSKDKTQLFRAEHSLEPVEDSTESADSTDDEEIASSSKSNPKKLFLYDGSNSQPKEPWDFTMKGGDTKLDENVRPKKSGRLQEKTVSPFTRNVSKRDDDIDKSERAGDSAGEE